MLDEIREYEEYTAPIAEGMPLRLKHCTLGEGGFSGVRRAMTIIARQALYPHGAPGDPDRQTIDRARQTIRSWCGFAEGPCARWLPDYYRHMIDAATRESGKNTRNLEQDLRCLLARDPDGAFIQDALWGRPWQQMLREGNQENNRKAIFYDGILSDAVDAGPLRRRYLIFHGDPLGRVMVKGESISARSGGRYFAGDQDRILKLVAAYFLQRTNPFQTSSEINKRDVTNWTATNSLSKRAESYTAFRYLPPGETDWRSSEPLLADMQKKVYGNACKIRVNPGFLAQFHIAVVEESELERCRNAYRRQYGGFGFYRDDGGGTPLLRDLEYGQGAI